MTTIGAKIRQLRRDKGITQSEMAEHLGVTSQAVSKWEGDLSQPDIALLPDIAAYFGIRIDDLFEYSKEKRYEKIEHMLDYAASISNTEYLNTESFLLTEIQRDAENYKAIHLLANLYEFWAASMGKKASHYAKRALELKPNSKQDMTIISNVNHGKVYDWNVGNHGELIDYWYKIIRDEPKNVRAYFFLLDNLIDDGRLTEARRVLEEEKCVNSDNLNETYDIWIDEIAAGFASVRARYERLAKTYGNDWRIQFSVANAFCRNECYEEAILYWQNGFDAMEPPRYTDFQDAIAQCYIRLGNYSAAIETYKKKKKLLQTEWGVKFGRELDEIDQIIDSLGPGSR